MRTFSIGFEEASFDELAGARAVASRYGTHHRELVLRPDAALLLPALAAAFDEPFADSSALPTYLVSKLAAEDVKVALSGEGGDELFGGYYTYVADSLAERVGPLATLARPLVERLPTSTRRVSFEYKAKRFVAAAHLPPLERHHGWKEIFSTDARAELTGRSSIVRPARDPPRALRRDGRARARDPLAGRRPGPLPRRRPADEDRSGVDGVVARGTRPVPGLGRDELRVLAAGAPQGARPLEEAAAAPSGRAAAAARGRARPQARLLDPGRRLAARRARAVRARDAVRRHDPPPGLLPARRP